MSEKLLQMHPEIVLFVGSCLLLVLGLSKARVLRSLCAPVTGICLALSAFVAIPSVARWLGLLTDEQVQTMPALLPFAKVMVAGVSLLLLPLLAGVVDRSLEAALRRGAPYDPGRSLRGEFYAFFLFSVTGVMLCATADDLIWMFLALELTSLPTYIMVAVSSERLRSLEAGVKYFFLGAFGAATFLMGFVLLYGAAGTTNLHDIAVVFREAGGLSPLATAGLVMAIVGVGFKIAAFPMHFYVADVYQGAAAPVAAYLAFAPKAAGFFALASLLSVPGWPGAVAGEIGQLDSTIRVVLWVMAALTMTVGNTLALLQTSAKRMLAYSSVAHSGYMLVGLLAGPGKEVYNDGLGAVLFYLLVYGVINVGAFAVIGALEKTNADGETVEAENLSDLAGLCRNQPLLGWSLVVCALALLGMPPLFGFWGKIPLFTSAISAGEITLVVIMALNSAAAALYYLRLAGAPLLSEPDPDEPLPVRSGVNVRRFAAVASASGAVLMVVYIGPLQLASHTASTDAYWRIQSGPRMRSVIFRPAPAAQAQSEPDRVSLAEPDAAQPLN